MKRPTNQPPTPIDAGDRRKSPYTARANDFRKRRRWKHYVMEPPERLLAEAKDEALAGEIRVWSAIKLFAWGNLSDFAIDRVPRASVEGLAAYPDDPEGAPPLTQKRLGEIIGIPTSTVNDAVRILKAIGYLVENHKFLCPIDSVKSLESSSKSAVDPDSPDFHSPLFRRFQQLVIERDEDAKIIPQLEMERNKFSAQAGEVAKEINKRRRRIWKLWRDYQRGKSPLGINTSLLESLKEQDVVA